MSEKRFKLNMMGGGFQHAYSSCGWEHPKRIIWDKHLHESPISVHIDDGIFDVAVNRNKINAAWFCESPFFMKKYTSKIKEPGVKNWLLETYKWVFISDKDILKENPEFFYVPPHARAWVIEKKIFPKTKLASIIASGKREAPGHQLRHIIVDTYKDFVDTYGSGYKPIDSKNKGLDDYMFSFAIENIKVNGYFTEKISDCFGTGTIPIYWGDETISDYFLEEGIIRLTDDFDPSILTKELYDSKKSYIEENFKRVLDLPLPEDYFYDKYIKPSYE